MTIAVRHARTHHVGECPDSCGAAKFSTAALGRNESLLGVRSAFTRPAYRDRTSPSTVPQGTMITPIRLTVGRVWRALAFIAAAQLVCSMWASLTSWTPFVEGTLIANVLPFVVVPG
jgi:hypothetical protein